MHYNRSSFFVAGTTIIDKSILNSLKELLIGVFSPLWRSVVRYQWGEFVSDDIIGLLAHIQAEYGKFNSRYKFEMID